MPKVAVKVGYWYRVHLVDGGALEGRVRSLSVPAGLMLNDDGRHSIWIAGDDIEWFLRPEEVEIIEEIGPPARAWACSALPPGHLRRYRR